MPASIIFPNHIDNTHKRKKPMPQTTDKTFHGQIIGGVFSSRQNADQAVKAFEDLAIPTENIQVLPPLKKKKATDVPTGIPSHGGPSAFRGRCDDTLGYEGKILVTVDEVIDPAAIIDIFDKYHAEHNPNGSRNLREDVLGMTAGAVVGAAAFCALGALLGGPAGATVGAIAGAVLGGGSGAVAGKIAEHSK